MGSKSSGGRRWLLAAPEHRLEAAFPGFSDADLAGVPAPRDLDDSLARPGIDAVIVGGPIELRGEYLRRAAAEGLAIICLHPPGPDSEAYYQVALSRMETGAVIVPHLPLRLHPGVTAMRQAEGTGEPGAFRGLRVESSSGGEGIDLARWVVPRLVDVVRALLGEIEALTATGDPPGDHPDLELIVQLRAAQGRRASCASARNSPTRRGSLYKEPARRSSWNSIRNFESPRASSAGRHPHPKRSSRSAPGTRTKRSSRCSRQRARHAGSDPPSPNLHDATRAMELSEATVRSLRRGRTVDLYYEPVSEEATFKSVMTSTGCMIFLGALSTAPTRPGRPPARIQLDDLHRVPDTPGARDFRHHAKPPLRRATPGLIGRSPTARREDESSRKQPT